MYTHKKRVTRQVWIKPHVPLPFGSSTHAFEIEAIAHEAIGQTIRLEVRVGISIDERKTGHDKAWGTYCLVRVVVADAA